MRPRVALPPPPKGTAASGSLLVQACAVCLAPSTALRDITCRPRGVAWASASQLLPPAPGQAWGPGRSPLSPPGRRCSSQPPPDRPAPEAGGPGRPHLRSLQNQSPSVRLPGLRRPPRSRGLKALGSSGVSRPAADGRYGTTPIPPASPRSNSPASGDAGQVPSPAHTRVGATAAPFLVKSPVTTGLTAKGGRTEQEEWAGWSTAPTHQSLLPLLRPQQPRQPRGAHLP